MAVTIYALTLCLMLGQALCDTLSFTSCQNKDLWGCLQCDNNAICTRCPLSYKLYPSDGSKGCTPCDPSCLECDAVTGKCLQCKSSDMGGCVSDGTCARCADNCLGCSTNGAGKCDVDACQPAYGLDPNFQCQKCSDPNCVTCVNDYSRCAFCKANYVVDPIPATCVLQGTPFTTQYQYSLKMFQQQHSIIPRTDCSNLQSCTSCTQDQKICLTCEDTYGLDESCLQNGCGSCIKGNCMRCSNINQCTQCSKPTCVPATGASANGTCICTGD